MSDPPQSASSAEIDFSDPERYDDVERKHRRMADILGGRKCDAWLLQEPSNFAWFTSGAPCPQVNPGRAGATLFLTRDARVLAANNVDAGFLFDRKLGGLGFQLKQRPWYEPRELLISELCRGRKMAVDTLGGAVAASALSLGEEVGRLRRVLGPIERERMRKLGQVVAHAVEATARNVEPGQTEAEVVAQLAHRLIRRDASPVMLRACVDGRTAAYRHWSSSSAVLQQYAMISATAARDGLHCTATRTVSFGPPLLPFTEAFHKATMLNATGMHFTRAGLRFCESWPKVKRIFEKQGLLDEWQLADQAEVTGYLPCETLLTPGCELEIESHMAVCWHASVGGAMGGDTVLIADDGFELLTPATEWPIITITVKGQSIALPDLLIRPPVR